MNQSLRPIEFYEQQKIWNKLSYSRNKILVINDSARSNFDNGKLSVSIKDFYSLIPK